jgi:protein-S-isoprenylcysteine O-methyltransferase Ste14
MKSPSNLPMFVRIWLGLLIGLFLFVFGTAIRVRSEERLLPETFGARFDDYRQRVPAVVPFVF